MFKCQLCNKVSQPKEAQNTLIVETRKMLYFAKEKALDDEGNEITVQGRQLGEGAEIVKEVKACINCAKRMSA